MLLLNLALPWMLLGVVAFLSPSSTDPHFYLLHGLQTHLSIYGLPALTGRFGLLGIFVPFAILHNLAFLFVRLIQARLDLEFLPMIRSVVMWVAIVCLAYWLGISFARGARFGEFHTFVLMILPLIGLVVGLAVFVGNHKGMSYAQITALLVAWAPAFSIAATLAGNHLRPQRFFSQVQVEPGGAVKGLAELDEKTRAQGFLRLSLDKEGIPLAFPSLARDLRVEYGADKKVVRATSELDPISTAKILRFPEQVEAAGWRSRGDNAKALAEFCLKSADRSQPLVMNWSKSDASMAITVSRCDSFASWSMSTQTQLFSLGVIDADRAAKIHAQRDAAPIKMADFDKTLLNDPDWRQRKLGYSLLAQINDASTIPLLGQGFYDKDVEVRQTAAVGLLSWGPKVEDFLSKALTDRDPHMRGDALRIVSLANRLRPQPAAFHMLNDPSLYVRVSAAQALAPFVKDTPVLKTLMQAFDREYARWQSKLLQMPKPEAAVKAASREFIGDPYVAELVVAIAHAEDVRTAATLLHAMPKVITIGTNGRGKPEFEAAHALRGMKNWLGVDYLQALVKRSPSLENREKALSVLAYLRKSGDEAAYLKALQDPVLRPHALTLVHAFESPAVTAALSKISADPDYGAR